MNPTDQGSLRDELRGDARTIKDSARTRILGEIDQRKGSAATQAKVAASALDAAAGKLDDSPEWLQTAFQSGARTLQQLAASVEQKNSTELYSDVRRLAQQNPASFLGACAVAGFAAARVLRAGSDQSAAMQGSNGLAPQVSGSGTELSVGTGQAGYSPGSTTGLST